jgi:hypothetical protein
MRVKRSKSKLTRIQREAVTLYCKLRAIKAEGMHDIKEAQGGKFHAFQKGSAALCKLCGLQNFWQEDVMMTESPDPPDHIKHNSWAYAGWQRGWKARCELEKLSSVL